MITEYQLWQDIRHRVCDLIPAAEHDLTMCFVHASRDPTASLTHGRKALETIVDCIGRYSNVNLSHTSLSNDIRQLETERAIHARIRARMESVRLFGNMAAHRGESLDEHDSDRSAADLLFIVNWLVGRPRSNAADDGVLSPPLTAALDLLRKRIDIATDEQKSVLNTLKRHRRLSVSGCAGSGKTLLAMEKAARLDGVGLTVLFLCHNPYLAEMIADALIYTDVRVSTFLDFLKSVGSTEAETSEWNHYADVSPKIIEAAFDTIVQSGVKFDAVIVDEAQDFLDDWWILIDGLVSPDTGFLYIFFDNNQALLPLRAKYPDMDHSHILSVNVRNSSEIAHAVGKLNRVPVTIRPELSGGTMRVRRFEKGGELPALSAAMSAIFAKGLIDRTAIVATEVVDPRHSSLSNLSVPLLPQWRWQDAIKDVLPRLVPHLGRTRAPSSPQYRMPFPKLSEAPYPDRSDVAAIARWARAIINSVNLKVPYVEGSVWLNVFADYVEFGGSVSPMSIAHFLSSERWAEQLPPQLTVKLVAIGSERAGLSIPLHSAASIKGLEADGVVTYVPTVVTDLKAHAYVALSRARLHQELVILQDVTHHLPNL